MAMSQEIKHIKIRGHKWSVLYVTEIQNNTSLQ